MANRSEPRKIIAAPVRIFGTSTDGRVFSERVTTVDVSQAGVRLAGVKALLHIGEIIGLTYGSNRIHFRVKWVGAPGTTRDGQIGLQNLTPERPLWDFPLPQARPDNFDAAAREDRRKSHRVKCSVSLELHQQNKPITWAKAADLSIGGCFAEMPIPLKVDSKLEIVLWLDNRKIRLTGSVASSAPGYGIGIRFLNVGAKEQTTLQQFLETIREQS